MNVMQVKKIHLKPSAKDELGANAYERVMGWLTHWTCEGNFKAVVTDSQEESLKLLRKDLYENLVPSWLKTESKVRPEMFTFEVSSQDVDDNRFWMPSGLIWCHDHEIHHE